MKDMEKLKQQKTAPLGEVFGFAADDVSKAAQTARTERFCPFKNGACNKAGGEGGRLGVCSLLTGAEDAPIYEPVCPSRFLDGGVVKKELEEFMIGGQTGVLIPEGHLSVKTPNGTTLPAGSVDWVLAEIKDQALLGYGAVEFQAVYTTGGGVQKAYKAFMAGQDTPERERGSLPDYRSSGRKRLTPQLQAKGKVFADNGIKQAVVLSEGLYESEFKQALTGAAVTEKESDFLWLVVKAAPGEKVTLKVVHKLYSTYEKTLASLQGPTTPDLGLFEEGLKRKLARGGFIGKEKIHALKD